MMVVAAGLYSRGIQMAIFTIYTFALPPLFSNFVQIMKRMTLEGNSKPFHQDETDVLTELEAPCNLIVWNDEVNTFEWVIETLVDICGHSAEQAEQCAYIIHYQGKYAVKNGSYDDLKPQCDAITDRGIGATIEVIA